jgi:DHA3 family macrolide efflux protein-like MFS transporter
VTNAPPELRQDDESGFLALMRHRNYALLWFGQLVSQTGDRFHWVAISLWVFQQTGSALSVSYAILALLVAPAFVGVFAGALVDRLDRRKILIYADLVRAVLVFAIPDLMKQGLIWVYLDLFFVSAASAFFRPAMFAAIPQSVSRDKLLKANAFFASMDTSTEIFGPILAGLVILQRGYSAALYLDAMSYLVSALFVSSLRLETPQARDDREQGRRDSVGTLDSIRDGLRYIRGDRIQIGLLSLLIGGYWVAGLNSLQTPMAKQVLGVSDSQFGWFLSIGGVGYVTASLLLGWYGRALQKGQTLVIAYLLWALSAGMVGLSANYGMLLVAGFWVGFANMLLFVNVGTIMMEHTPSGMIGRTITTRQVVVACMRATALLGFGWLADHAGTRISIMAMAGISLVGTVLAAVKSPELRQYQSASMVDVAGVAPARESRLARSAIGPLLSRLIGNTDPQFAMDEQLRLNGIVTLIIAAGWVAYLVLRPVPALAIAAAIALTLMASSGARMANKRLRDGTGGKGTG